jgi:signal peptidase II
MTAFKKNLKKCLDYVAHAKAELIVIAAAIFVDLLTKGIVEANMSEGQVVSVIPNFLEWCFVYNDKAAFSFDFFLSNVVGLDGVRVIFIIITIFALAAFGFILYKIRMRHGFSRIALALVIGGAIGNLYDRLFVGRVRDFIQVVFFGLDIEFLGGRSFAVFNIADSCLVIGVIMLMVYIVFTEAFEKHNPRALKSANSTEQNTVLTANSIETSETADGGEETDFTDNNGASDDPKI